MLYRATNYPKKRKVKQGKGTLFRNIKNTGRWHYSALDSRRGSYALVGSYILIGFPSWSKEKLIAITFENEKEQRNYTKN